MFRGIGAEGNFVRNAKGMLVVTTTVSPTSPFCPLCSSRGLLGLWLRLKLKILNLINRLR